MNLEQAIEDELEKIEAENPLVDNKKEKKIKAWILCHHGMGTGTFQIYRTKGVAETAFIEKQCECTEKPVSCVITYTPKYLV